jgi:tryptophan synthase alpha chain
MKRILMAHQVAGFPSDEIALRISDALVEGGAQILEIQLPFSDPSADGPAIQTACSRVLERGYTVEEGFDFISAIHKKHPQITIFLMTYASLAYARGIENFVEDGKKAGVKGFIIPDLPFDCDEGLALACKKAGLYQIPVVAPSMSSERLETIQRGGYEYLYCALRAGITGSKTSITEDSINFLKQAGKGNSKLLGGFGIVNGEQAAAVSPYVYAIVAGSVFVNLIRNTVEKKEVTVENFSEMYKQLSAKAAELSGL